MSITGTFTINDINLITYFLTDVSDNLVRDRYFNINEVSTLEY